MNKPRISTAIAEQIARSGGRSCNTREFAWLAADLLDARRRIAELEQSTGETGTYKLFVWESPSLWIVAVHARSVKEARELALSDEFDLGGTDGSCPDRAAARKAVIETTPEIYRGKQGFSMFAEDAERIAELEKDVERLDWCSRNKACAVSYWDEWRVQNVYSVYMTDSYATARAAIDAAIAAQRQKEGE